MRVGDFVTLRRGTTYRGMLVGKPGPALLGLGSIVPGGGFRDDYQTYGGECPRELMLFPGDLFVSLKGATKDGEMIGSVARVPSTVRSGRLTQDTVRLVFAKRHPEFERYLYWLLRTPHYRGYCAGRATGSAVVALSRDDFLAYPVPPLTVARQSIVEALENVEDTINLNRRMNDTLEAMARTLFKSWFESCPANEAREVKVDQLRADGCLEIGDGYRAKNTELGAKGLPFARAGNIDGGFDFADVDYLCDSSVSAARDKISRECDIVFTSKGTIGRFAFVDPKFPPFVYSPQLCFWRSLDRHRLNPFVLFQWMQSRWFLDQVDRVKGQTDMAEYVSLRDQRSMTVGLVGTPQDEVGQQLRVLQERVWCNVAESQTLASLRDLLLPRLLSGTLRIPDAERLVDAVT